MTSITGDRRGYLLLVLIIVIISSFTSAKPFTANFTQFLTRQYSGDTYIQCVDNNFCYEVNGPNAWISNNTITVANHRMSGGARRGEYYFLLTYYRPNNYERITVRRYYLNGTYKDTILDEIIGNTLGWGSLRCGESTNNKIWCKYDAYVSPSQWVHHSIGFTLGDDSVSNYRKLNPHGSGTLNSAVGYLGDELIMSKYQNSNITIYIENTSVTGTIDVLATFSESNLDTSATFGGVSIAGGYTESHVVYKKTDGTIKKIMIAKDVSPGYTYYAVSPPSTFVSGWTTFDCASSSVPLCLGWDASQSAYYMWLFQIFPLSYDVSGGYISTPVTAKATISYSNYDNHLYMVAKSSDHYHSGLKTNMSQWLTMYPVTIYMRNQVNAFISPGDYRCGNQYGYVCAQSISDDTIYAIETYNLYQREGYDRLPGGYYRLSYTSATNQNIVCAGYLHVTSAPYSSRYTIYYGSDDCTSPEAGGSVYSIHYLGGYGAIRYNVTDNIIFHSVYDANRQVLVTAPVCTTLIGNNTYNNSPTYADAIESSKVANYIRVFSHNLTAGNYSAVLNCSGIPRNELLNITIVSVNGTTPASINVTQSNIRSLRKNLIKLRFTQNGSNDNIMDGICYVTTASGHTYNMYLSTIPDCGKISSMIGGEECQACIEATGKNCFYYLVINSETILYPTDYIYNGSVTCYSPDYTATTNITFNYTNISIKLINGQIWDWKNSPTDTLYFTNQSDRDLFRFVGYSLFSNDNPTPTVWANQKCKVTYDICIETGEGQYIQQSSTIDMEIQPTRNGIGFMTGFLPTSQLCNGRNFSTSTGVSMPTKGRYTIRCTADDVVFSRYDGYYTAKIMITDIDPDNVGSLTSLSGGAIGKSGTAIAKIIMNTMDVIYFVMRILTNVFLSHMLETTFLLLIIVFFTPLALKMR